MQVAEDLTGHTYNRLTVESLAYIVTFKRYWKCRCVCGRGVIVQATNLKSGHSKSCGCFRDAVASARSRTHGHTVGKRPSAEYRTWQGILTRCTNPKTKAYKYYGGRGIAVCREWCADFEAFLRDMGPRPSPRHSIERRDNESHYTAANCYWATKAEQAINTRQNHFLELNGERKTLSQWASGTGMKALIISKRLKRGWSVERALTEPLMKNQFRYR